MPPRSYQGLAQSFVGGPDDLTFDQDEAAILHVFEESRQAPTGGKPVCN
jgi:hypothetical protein